MANSPYPLPDSLRESDILLGDGASATYGPFGFAIFDAADVTVYTSDSAEQIWTETDVTVTKLTDTPLAFFTITFPAILPTSMRFTVQSARRHTRNVSVFKGGTLVADELEKELSKQGSAVQELRRDIDRAVRLSAGSGLANALLPPPLADYVLGWDANGNRIVNAISVASILEAQGYADDILEAINQILALVPDTFPTLAAAQAYQPAIAPPAIETRGLAAAGDGQGRMWKKVASEPVGPDGKFFITQQDTTVVWYEAYTSPFVKIMRGHHALQKIAVILVSGQSNAVGASTGGDLTTNPNVLVYRPTTGTIEVANPALSPFNGNNNAGFQAAKRHQERYGGKVLIILAAQGATPLTEWNPGGSQWTKITTDVPAALALIGQTTVDRVLWLKGEAEYLLGTIVGMRAMEAVLDQFRAQAWWLKGHTYMIANEMTQARGNAQQGQTLAYRLLSEKTADFVMVSSFDIPTDAAQGIHFSGDGLTEIGLRFAETMALPYGHAPRPTRPRFSPGNIFFTVDPTPGDDVDFTDLFEALTFFSTIRLAHHASATVTVRGKHSLTGASIQLALEQGGQWLFQGVLDSEFAQPTKDDISATEATALTYLRTQYLTELEIANKLFILNGNNCGVWKDMLWCQNGTAGAISGAIISNEASFTTLRSQAGGSIRCQNIVFHRWQGPSSGAILAIKNDHIELHSTCLFSHCTRGITTAYATVEAVGVTFAHCSNRDVHASDGAHVNVRDSKTNSANATTGWRAESNAYVDLRGGENQTSVSEVAGGHVEVDP